MSSIKPDLAEVEYQVLTETHYQGLRDYETSPIVKELLSGSTILVPTNTAIHRMYRFAKTKGLTLHKRKTEDGLVLWLEKAINPLQEIGQED